jgi:hypothetical protein
VQIPRLATLARGDAPRLVEHGHQTEYWARAPANAVSAPTDARRACVYAPSSILPPTVLELRLARSFIAVAEEGHFARAAQRLHITQPALSRQIQQLERELGVRLLTRVGRAARLTVAGRVFLDHARRLLTMADAAAIAARRASEGIIGRLVVGFVSPATYSVLPATFRAFRERAPTSRSSCGSSRRAHRRKRCVRARSTSGCCTRRSRARRSSACE